MIYRVFGAFFFGAADKINNAVNPYDPQWEIYLEKRLSLKMAASLKGRMTVLSLWKRQHGRCPHCGEALTTMTG